MPSPTPEALALGQRFALVLARPRRSGPAGELLGRAVGSSLEFADRRDYAPGDDVRHLDWRAFARTERLLVRQYTEEVRPHVELLVDDSRSMAIEDDKAQCAVDLAAVLALAARRSGASTRILALGARVQPLETERLLAQGLAFEGRRDLGAQLAETRASLRRGSLRFVLSDLLFPTDPGAAARSLGRDAGGLCVLQLLGARDVDPPAGALRLRDAEERGELDLRIDGGLRRRYLERLQRLQDGWSELARAQAGRFVGLRATDGLEALVRGELCARDVLAPCA